MLVSSERLRDSDTLNGKRGWLDRPSTLFDLLLRADARDATARATRYYELGIRLAHAAASVDLVPSPAEIAAIDKWRLVLLGAFDTQGVGRPGRPATAGVHGYRPRRRPRRSPSCHRSDRSRSCSPSSTRSSGCSR